MKVSCYQYKATDKARLIGTTPNKGPEAFWVPKSSCSYTKIFSNHPTLGVRLHLTFEGWFVPNKPELDKLQEGHIFR